ncbi:tyrosine-type recombinase/integrase [Microbacterium sp.]|uniref:tyrosine-type recombinase/integrase n=1 Tax=Microbacterium sp. TaxID=51671 RepID=UPI003F9D7CD0
MRANEAVESYLEQLRSKGRQPSTVRGYETDLRVLVRVAAKQGGEIDGEVVCEYLAWPTAQAAATRARRLSALRGLLRSCGGEHFLPAVGDLERPRASEPRRPSYRDLRPEIDAVFAVIPHYAERDQLVFGLLAHLGLRPGEVLALQVHDVEEASASLFVTGWGGKRRRVLVDNRDVLLRLTNYVRFAALPSGPLFTAPGRETPLRYQSIQHRWAQYCATAGVDVQLTDLRRAHVADLMAGGVPEAVIRERIGRSTGALAGAYVSFSSEDSDAQIRAWRERREAQTAGTRTSTASERDAG